MGYFAVSAAFQRVIDEHSCIVSEHKAVLQTSYFLVKGLRQELG